MTVVITNGHFGETNRNYTPLAEIDDLAGFSGNLDLTSDVNPQEIAGKVGNVSSIRIDFPSSADGRGNSIATALRRAGYRGHLRAHGHVLADQYPLAVRCGFDDVEISSELARRQPKNQWRDTLKRIELTYLNVVKAAPALKAVA